MSFSHTVNDSGVPEFLGRKKCVSGTFTNLAGGTGGTIETGLRRIDFFQAKSTSGATTDDNIGILTNPFPLEMGDIRIITNDGVDGIWMAFGE